MNKETKDGERGAWEPLMVAVSKRDEVERRELWLVSRGEVDRVKARLSALDAKLKQGAAGWWEIKSLTLSLSKEAKAQSDRLGWGDALYVMANADEKERLEPELEALERLRAQGAALGPARLERREDGRVFELDAALAGAALMERREIELLAAGASGGAKPGARL